MYLISLLSAPAKENLEFFFNIYKNNFEGCNLNTKQNYLTFKNKDNINQIIFIKFENQELKLDETLKSIYEAKKLGIKDVTFLCFDCDEKLITYLKSFKDFNISILQKSDIYFKVLYPNNAYPDIKFNIANNSKIKFKQLLSISLERTRAKGYFISGLIIFFCSFFVRYNFYYVFMSSTLFLLTAICLFKKNKVYNK